MKTIVIISLIAAIALVVATLGMKINRANATLTPAGELVGKSVPEQPLRKPMPAPPQFAFVYWVVINGEVVMVDKAREVWREGNE